MNPQEFARWVERMLRERALAKREIAELLGTTVPQLARWSTYRAPPYVALAIAAVMNNLAPWREPRKPVGRRASRDIAPPGRTGLDGQKSRPRQPVASKGRRRVETRAS